MRKKIQQYLPTNESIKNQRWLKPFHGFLAHHNLWHLNRRSVSGGVAVGLFCGLVPGPFQILSATILAVFFRVNLPVAAFATVYTNPFTIVPLYMLAYSLGALVTGVEGQQQAIEFPALTWDGWFDQLWGWMKALGEPLLIGLPLLAGILALAGYFIVRFGWRWWVVQRWRKRHFRKTPSH